MKSVPTQTTRFPLFEGVSVFVGVLAWDMLFEGHLDLLKALLIAIPCSLAWYAIRYCRRSAEKK